ncbi:MAG: helix-turn-helix transcriptional regulator [Gammaproteobacteria bacterium]|nr:helix-turn-helix transcriptional regulator [Gammaproteobacteria bacterium]
MGGINKLNIIIAAASVGQAAPLILLLLRSAVKNRANYWLALALAGLSINCIATLFLQFDMAHQGALLLAFVPTAVLSIGPALWLYIRTLTQPVPAFRRRDALHFALPIAAVVFTCGVIIDGRLELLVPDMNVSMTSQTSVILIMMAPAVAQILVYLLAVFRAVTQYRRRLVEQFSEIESRSLNWVTGLFGVAFGLWLAWAMTWTWSLQIGNSITAIGIAIYIGYMGYYGVIQRSIYIRHGVRRKRSVATTANSGRESAHAPPAMEESAVSETPMLDRVEAGKYVRSTLTAEQIAVLQARLEAVIKTDKPYLEEDLTLADLAEQIDATPNQLSQLINQHMGANFYDFINRMRIDAVKRAIDDPSFDSFSLLDVAYISGFRSKTTFNSVFKRVEGMTPSEYRKTRSRQATAA